MIKKRVQDTIMGQEVVLVQCQEEFPPHQGWRQGTTSMPYGLGRDCTLQELDVTQQTLKQGQKPLE